MKANTTKRKLSKKSHFKKGNPSLDKPVSKLKKPVGSKTRKTTDSIKKQVINNSKPVRRDSNGHILPGSGSNGGGRPKGSLSGIKASELIQSVSRVHLERMKKIRKGKERKFASWLDYLVNKSYEDTSLAIAILARIYPALKSIEQVNLDANSLDDIERANLWAAYTEKRFDT